jgi:hypothetical protein
MQKEFLLAKMSHHEIATRIQLNFPYENDVGQRMTSLSKNVLALEFCNCGRLVVFIK